MTKETALPLAKLVTDVVERTTLLKNASKVIMMLNQSHATGPGVRVTMTSVKSCGKYKKDFHSVEMDSDCEGCSNSNQMEDLTEQVQSLFYH